jgi:4-aminobutyrate aminotransferase-like enzyme
MVFGIECAAAGGLSADEVASKVVETCYRGDASGDGIHILGPLAGCVLRVSPPLTITSEEAEQSLGLLFELVSGLADTLR